MPYIKAYDGKEDKIFQFKISALIAEEAKNDGVETSRIPYPAINIIEGLILHKTCGQWGWAYAQKLKCQ